MPSSIRCGKSCAQKRSADLARHILIYARNRLQWRTWLETHRLEDLTIRREMAVDQSTMANKAAVERIGMILESDFLAAEEVANSRLVEPFQDSVPTPQENAHFLFTSRMARIAAPVKLFIAWLDTLVSKAP